MSPRYRLTPVTPNELETGDRIQVRLNVPSATHTAEYVVTKTDEAEQIVHAVDAYDADATVTHLKYEDWLFARAEA